MPRVPKKLTELDGFLHLDDRVLIYRTTQVTEEVSYVEGRSFAHTLNSYYFKYNDIEFTPPGRLISNNFDSIANDLLQYIEMLANVPLGAKIIPVEELPKYEGKLLAGWLLDSKCTKYGFLNSTTQYSFSGYSLGCVWEIPQDIMKELTTYVH
jgi:hypothetical protein